MLGGLISSFAGEWKAWKTAFRGLPDNPLAQYFTLMRKRRLAKLPWENRNAFVLFGVCLAGLSIIVMNPMAPRIYGYAQGMGISQSQQSLLVFLQVIAIVVFAISILAFFWFLQVLWNSLHSTLSFLGILDSSGFNEGIDELAGISLITEREFGAAAVSHSFVPLIKPLAALVTSNQLSRVLNVPPVDMLSPSATINRIGIIPEFVPLGWHESALLKLLDLPGWQLNLIVLPFDSILNLTASLLGALSLVCLLIVVGKNQLSPMLVHATGAMLMVWILLGSYTVMVYSAGYDSFPSMTGALKVLWMVFCCLAVPFLFLVILKSLIAMTSSQVASVTILLLLFLPVIACIGCRHFGSDFYWEFVDSVGWGSMVFSPLNPASLIVDPDWELYRQFPDGFPWVELFRAPILIVVQLLTLAGLSPILLKAISLRRQG